jgi:methionyl-tRNA synthetase
MSKSRGTFIQARQFSAHFPTDALRYYFAVKMNGGLEDLDLNSDDFIVRINSDLIGKLVNIASRSAGFIHKFFSGQLSTTLTDLDVYQQWSGEAKDIIQAYQQRDNARAIRMIMFIADKINQYVDAKKPWLMVKDEALLPEVQGVCTMALNGFRLLMIFLQPVLPMMSIQVKQFFQETDWSLQHLQPLLNQQISNYEPLMTRLQHEQWQQMLSTAEVSA